MDEVTRGPDNAAAAEGALGLSACETPLWAAYDLAMLDLDGVVYIGAEAVPGVAEHLAAAANAGLTPAFVTNNASRTPRAIAEHLRRLGVAARVEDVVTSAQAAARLVAERVAPGSLVFVIGGEGLMVALHEAWLAPTQAADDEPVAVASGYGPDLRWSTVVDGAILVRSGLPWIASNTDMTIPTAHGHGPGNGVLVRAVADYAGVTPVVAGKPESPLFHETVRRVGGSRPLVVGDRLDTDIEGATRAGYASLLVMTGVTGLPELLAAPPEQRPSYVAATLAALGRPHAVPEHRDGTWTQGGWRVRLDGGSLAIEGEGETDDWLRCVAAAGWDLLDREGRVVDVDRLAAPEGLRADA